jgi:2-amino-4-hydroxy-6-hydroxymethyldihydropteridine diphosphokinase
VWKLNATTPDQTHTACILLGSNIAPEQNIHTALQLLKEKLHLVKLSSIWHTPAVGSQGPDFLNMAVIITTDLDQPELREFLRSQESRLGRLRTGDKFAPRTIDLDIIVFDDKVWDPALWNLAHVAIPISELLPNFNNPASGRTLTQISQTLQQAGTITLYEGTSRILELIPGMLD